VTGWRYHQSTTHIFVFIYDAMQGDYIEGWVYRVSHYPLDDDPDMMINDRTKLIRGNRADWRKREMGLLPPESE